MTEQLSLFSHKRISKSPATINGPEQAIDLHSQNVIALSFQRHVLLLFSHQNQYNQENTLSRETQMILTEVC